MTTDTVKADTYGVVAAAKDETKDWYAWNNLMPPMPNDFHVVGKVLAPNPGVIGELTERVPQGSNPNYKLLNLHLIQRPGLWPQIMTWINVRYDELPSLHLYTHAEIFDHDEVIAQMTVSNIS